jgi:ribosomal protein L40E
MSCKNCASDNLQNLKGELNASFPDMKNLAVSPIYVCQEILVCRDCGFTELRLAAAELQQIKRGR